MEQPVYKKDIGLTMRLMLLELQLLTASNTALKDTVQFVIRILTMEPTSIIITKELALKKKPMMLLILLSLVLASPLVQL